MYILYFIIEYLMQTPRIQLKFPCIQTMANIKVVRPFSFFPVPNWQQTKVLNFSLR